MKCRHTVLLLTAVAVVTPSHHAVAMPPKVPTPGPAIYLQENLDEPEQLGFCIDTKTRFFNEELHAHSCKPRGEDFWFAYDAGTGRIMSATFEDKCVAAPAGAKTGDSLSLLDCTDGEEQRFEYVQDSLELRVSGTPTLCVIAGTETRQAGPFVARDLLIDACDDTDPARKQWLMKDADG